MNLNYFADQFVFWNLKKIAYGYIKYASMFLTRTRPHSYSKRHSDKMFCPHCNKNKGEN